MYFASRMQAGRMLAAQIVPKYGGEDCVVVALSDGGVVVGSQVALALHAPLCMILSDEIVLPRESFALAGITQDGSFSYNHALSSGEIDEYVGEYRGAIEAQKLEKLHRLHRDTTGGDLIRDDILDDRTIILVSDGLSSGFALDLAVEYLKPVSFKKLVMAAPFASVQAVDRMHLLADDLFCIHVQEDFISVDHYYDTQDVPKHELVLKTVARIVADWKPTPRSTALMVEIPRNQQIPAQSPQPVKTPAVPIAEAQPLAAKPKQNGLLAKLQKWRHPRVKLPTRRRFTVSNRANGSGRSK